MPVSWLEAGFPCAVQRMLGVDCPGCGCLRSWSWLAHGQWAQAFRLYPLGPLMYAGLWLYVLDEIRVAAASTWWKRSARPWIRPLLMSRWLLLLLPLLALQWIAKLVIVW